MKIVEAVRLLGADGPHDVLWEASAACVCEYLSVLGKILVVEGNLYSQDLDDVVADDAPALDLSPAETEELLSAIGEKRSSKSFNKLLKS